VIRGRRARPEQPPESVVTVIPLHAANPGPMTGLGNWTYLLPGSTAVLVDAGVGQAAHVDALFARVPDGPDAVLVTHIHPDHASGAPAIAARAPRARFMKYRWAEHDDAVGVNWAPLSDGQHVDSPEGPLEVVHTPGHSPDHVVFWHEASGTVFTGDLLVLGSTVVIPATHGGSLSAYLASLARVVSLRPTRALPAHGPVIDDPVALIDHYIAHRRQRETQILEALSAGEATVAAIAARIYRDLDPALMPQAHESVLAHLLKLADDGVATRRSDQWRRR
jgi:glyoxylase-like metal-dependent hydrolase (beta-lactamase superfamily II)